MATIVAERPVKNCGVVEAVRGIDLEVAAGEVLGFLGPNGAGKANHGQHAVHPAAAHLRQRARGWARRRPGAGRRSPRDLPDPPRRLWSRPAPPRRRRGVGDAGPAGRPLALTVGGQHVPLLLEELVVIVFGLPLMSYAILNFRRRE